MEKGGIEDLFKKQVPRSLYRGYNATKHLITFYNGSNLFFGHVKTDRWSIMMSHGGICEGTTE